MQNSTSMMTHLFGLAVSSGVPSAAKVATPDGAGADLSQVQLHGLQSAPELNGRWERSLQVFLCSADKPVCNKRWARSGWICIVMEVDSS